MGVFLRPVSWMSVRDKETGTYCWLHVRMNCAALEASFGFRTESWLATIPTGKPMSIIQYRFVRVMGGLAVPVI